MKEIGVWREGNGYSRGVAWRTLWRKMFGECRKKRGSKKDKRGGRIRRETETEHARRSR